MHILKIKKNNILKVILVLVFIIIVAKATISFGMQNYYNLDFSTGLVTASSLNVRCGPRNEFSSNCKSI